MHHAGPRGNLGRRVEEMASPKFGSAHAPVPIDGSCTPAENTQGELGDVNKLAASIEKKNKLNNAKQFGRPSSDSDDPSRLDTGKYHH